LSALPADPGPDPELVRAWLTARSIVRGLPLPVPEHGGLRVDTGSPAERRRYVFSHVVPAIGELAEAIVTPAVPIKLCGPGEDLLALVPPRWTLQPPAYLMTGDAAHDPDDDAARLLPAGYRLQVTLHRPVIVATIAAPDGSLAASGNAAECGGVFVVDRILVQPGHRRRGLGRALMAALAATQRSRAARRVLVATEAGRALYATLGWTVRSPYSTVVIEGPAMDDGHAGHGGPSAAAA
jgi:GNAT superfamily N-acetyltransferase